MVSSTPLFIGMLFQQCRAEEKHWSMAVSSMLSDAKAMVFNHSECPRTHHERPPPTPTPRAHLHHTSAWEVEIQPHAVCAGVVHAWAVYL